MDENKSSKPISHNDLLKAPKSVIQWKLRKPRISLRVGIAGSKDAVGLALRNSTESTTSCLSNLLGGLVTTLERIRESDGINRFDFDVPIPWTAVVSRLFQTFGYRVDKKTLRGKDVAVYTNESPQLLLRVMEKCLLQILVDLQEKVCSRFPSSKDEGEPQDSQLIPSIVTELVELGATDNKTDREEAFSLTLLLHHVDLLIVVWRKDIVAEYETADVMIRRAIADGTEVIAIQLHSEADACVAIVQSERELDLMHRCQLDRSRLLESCVSSLTMSEQDLGLLRSQWNPTMEFPDAPCNEAETISRYSAFLYHPRAAFLKLAQLESPSESFTGRFWIWYKTLTDSLYNFWHSKAHSSAKISPHNLLTPNVNELALLETWDKNYQAIYSAADESFSGPTGRTYRGGIVASCVLAVVAVMLAMLGAWLHFKHELAQALRPVISSAETSDHHENWSLLLSLVLAAVEFAVVIWMFCISLWSVGRGWRLQFTENRVLAEALRVWRFLMPLGLHTPMPRLPHYLRGDGVAPSVDATWSLWYFRALVREFPIVSAQTGQKTGFDERLKILRFLAADQYNYHNTNAEKQHFIHEAIEFLSKFLFVLVLGCVGLHVCELFSGRNLYAAYGTGICIGGPLVIALLHGFEAQLEIQRLRQRSASVAKLLKERYTELDRIDHDVKVNRSESPEDKWHLVREGLQIGSILIDETAGWSMLYRARDIHTG